uniref:TOG domain-containing protein n=1 Tax=Arundo donax TaxID=35708 RepID=A0A0A8XN31_ARUDO
MECLNDGTPEVRDASFSAMSAIAKMVGMKPLERSLEKLDDVRKKKLSDMIGSAGDAVLSSGTATISNSGAATSAHGVTDSLSMKRSAASMLSGKKPVAAATKKCGPAKPTAAKKDRWWGTVKGICCT